jgi:hypothetical protein
MKQQQNLHMRPQKGIMSMLLFSYIQEGCETSSNKNESISSKEV